MATPGPKPGSPSPNPGGRPPGPSKKTLRLLEEARRAAALELSPLKVMTDNMVFWHEQSVALSTRIQRILDTQQTLEPDVMRDLIKLMNKFVVARDQAQKCAVDAAPYVHPKLATITVDKEVEKKITVTGGLPADV